jgi:BirA family biotin operon repressor/biotin-[acetyl-CoA-carboxylase] ligase
VSQELLKALKAGPVRGPELARALGLSRAGLWKRIQALRRRGYRIEASRAGYRLLQAPELSAEELQALLPQRLILYKELAGSTNDLAHQLAQKGAPGGSLVVADAQSHGRGRMGRAWVSPPGVNLYMSMLLRPALSPQEAQLLTLAVALATAQAIKGHTGLQVALRWPNDLLVGRKKLGGVLLEMRTEPDRLLYVVAGIGVNVNARKTDFPPSLRPLATSLRLELGRQVPRAALAARIAKEVEAWTGLLQHKGPQPVLKACRALSAVLGQRVLVRSQGRVFEGIAEDIDPLGRLLLRESSGRLLRFFSADVQRLSA